MQLVKFYYRTPGIYHSVSVAILFILQNCDEYDNDGFCFGEIAKEPWLKSMLCYKSFQKYRKQCEEEIILLLKKIIMYDVQLITDTHVHCSGNIKKNTMLENTISEKVFF